MQNAKSHCKIKTEIELHYSSFFMCLTHLFLIQVNVWLRWFHILLQSNEMPFALLAVFIVLTPFSPWLRIVYWKCSLPLVKQHYLMMTLCWSHIKPTLCYVMLVIAKYFLCKSFCWLHFQEHSKLEFRSNPKLKNIYILLCSKIVRKLFAGQFTAHWMEFKRFCMWCHASVLSVGCSILYIANLPSKNSRT